MAQRGTGVTDRPSTQVDERRPGLSRLVMGAIVLIVAALAVGLALALTSDGTVTTQDVPAADTDAVPAADTREVPYTGDWKDSLIEVERAKEASR